MTATTFRFVSLADVDISGWDLSTVVFDGVETKGPTGAVSGVPAAWGPFRSVQGVLLGPGVFVYNGTITGQDLTGIDLRRATFMLSNIADCDLSGANFEGAFLNCPSCGAYTPNTGSSIVRCNVDGARFAGAYQYRLYGADWTGTPATLPSGWELVGGFLVARGAIVGGANLSGVDLAGRDFRDTAFIGTNFTGANLAGADFSTWSSASILANFTDANLAGANFSGTSFGPNSSGSGILRLAGANIDGTRFTNASIRMVASGQLTGNPVDLPPTHRIANGYLVGPKAVLHDAMLTGADLRGANLFEALLSSADLSHADLTGASLRGIWSWYGTNLSFANLTGADLTGSSQFQYANTTGAVWQGTICPSGGAPQDCSCQSFPDGGCP